MQGDRVSWGRVCSNRAGLPHLVVLSEHCPLQCLKWLQRCPVCSEGESLTVGPQCRTTVGPPPTAIELTTNYNNLKDLSGVCYRKLDSVVSIPKERRRCDILILKVEQELLCRPCRLCYVYMSLKGLISVSDPALVSNPKRPTLDD